MGNFDLFFQAPETQNPTTTNMDLQEGSTIQLNQPFIMRMGSDNVPVEITFNSTWMWTNAGKADAGYKYLDLQVVAKNVGTKEVTIFSISDKWETTVDKGYVYDNIHSPFAFETVRPEEVKMDIVDFAILATTTPVEVRYYDGCLASTSSCSPTFTLDLRDVTIPVRERNSR